MYKFYLKIFYRAKQQLQYLGNQSKNPQATLLLPNRGGLSVRPEAEYQEFQIEPVQEALLPFHCLINPSSKNNEVPAESRGHLIKTKH